MKLETKFDIGNHVDIVPYNVKGTVKEINIDRTGVTYLCKYFYNGDMKQMWVDEEDLKLLDDSVNQGFGFLCNK